MQDLNLPSDGISIYCIFCKRQAPAGKPELVKMWRYVLHGQGQETKIDWHRINRIDVEVPQCHRCAKLHGHVWIVGTTIGLFMFVLVLGSSFIEGLLVGTLIGGVIGGLFSMFYTRLRGSRPGRFAHSHPTVLALKADGWRVGSKPAGTR